MSLIDTSRFISLVLRHKPSCAGITLDSHGWADVNELIAGVNKKHPLDMRLLEEIVATDEKGRYSFNEDNPTEEFIGPIALTSTVFTRKVHIMNAQIIVIPAIKIFLFFIVFPPKIQNTVAPMIRCHGRFSVTNNSPYTRREWRLHIL